MTLFNTELAFANGICFFLTEFLKKDGEQMTGAGNSLTLYLPNRPLPEDGAFSIPAMEQRLISMLEELDRDIGCSRASRPPIDGRLSESPASGEWLKSAFQVIFNLKDACAAETRAVAFVVAVGGLAGLCMSFASLARAPNLFETMPSSIETGITKAPGGAATDVVLGTEGVSAIKSWAQSTSLAPFDGAADSASRPQTTNESEGLSIDEFNARVRRLFGQRQAIEQGRGAMFESWPGGAFAPKNEAQSAVDEPLPIAPPAATTLPEPKLETVTADLAAEPLNLVNFDSSRRLEHTPVVSGGKGKAPAAGVKVGSHKVANKRSKSQARQPMPAPADNGPLAFIQGAAEAISGVVKDWGQVASRSREEEKSPNPSNR
jgi:hypothetical protein